MQDIDGNAGLRNYTFPIAYSTENYVVSGYTWISNVNGIFVTKTTTGFSVDIQYQYTKDCGGHIAIGY